MMNDFLIIQLIFFILIMIGCCLLINKKKSLFFVNRIGIYGLDSVKVEKATLFTNVSASYLRIVKRLRNPLSKMIIFKSIIKRYDNYEYYSNNLNKEAVDYVIDKILLGLMCVFITFLSSVFSIHMITLTDIFISFVVGYVSLDIYFNYKKKMRIKRIREDLLKAIIVMNSAFKAGKTTVQALEITKNELSYPTNIEFTKMYEDITYGLDLDVVFERFAKRVNIEEAKYIASSLTILQKTGGNIVKVFNSIERSLFDKKKLNEELKNLTVNSNLVVKILMLVPFIFIGSITFLNPTYFIPLVQSVQGYYILILMVVMFIIYILLLKKIMKVKV